MQANNLVGAFVVVVAAAAALGKIRTKRAGNGEGGGAIEWADKRKGYREPIEKGPRHFGLTLALLECKTEASYCRPRASCTPAHSLCCQQAPVRAVKTQLPSFYWSPHSSGRCCFSICPSALAETKTSPLPLAVRGPRGEPRARELLSLVIKSIHLHARSFICLFGRPGWPKPGAPPTHKCPLIMTAIDEVGPALPLVQLQSHLQSRRPALLAPLSWPRPVGHDELVEPY